MSTWKSNFLKCPCWGERAAQETKLEKIEIRDRSQTTFVWSGHHWPSATLSLQSWMSEFTAVEVDTQVCRLLNV